MEYVVHAVRVNGVKKLACKTIIQDGDFIEPLKDREVVKDLVVNVSLKHFDKISTKSYINKYDDKKINPRDIKKIDLQVTVYYVILASSCPVYVK